MQSNCVFKMIFIIFLALVSLVSAQNFDGNGLVTAEQISDLVKYINSGNTTADLNQILDKRQGADDGCRNYDIPCDITVSPANCILCEYIGADNTVYLDWICLGIQLGISPDPCAKKRDISEVSAIDSTPDVAAPSFELEKRQSSSCVGADTRGCRNYQIPCDISVSPINCSLCVYLDCNNQPQVDWVCLGIQLGISPDPCASKARDLSDTIMPESYPTTLLTLKAQQSQAPTSS